LIVRKLNQLEIDFKTLIEPTHFQTLLNGWIVEKTDYFGKLDTVQKISSQSPKDAEDLLIDIKR
jgi:hypothetical protein